MGSEDTFIFSVLLQTKILHPLLYGLGVYVTKPGKYAMVVLHETSALLQDNLNMNASAVVLNMNSISLPKVDDNL